MFALGGLLFMLLYLVIIFGGIGLVIAMVVAIFQIKRATVEISRKLDRLDAIYEWMKAKDTEK